MRSSVKHAFSLLVIKCPRYTNSQTFSTISSPMLNNDFLSTRSSLLKTCVLVLPKEMLSPNLLHVSLRMFSIVSASWTFLQKSATSSAYSIHRIVSTLHSSHPSLFSVGTCMGYVIGEINSPSIREPFVNFICCNFEHVIEVIVEQTG